MIVYPTMELARAGSRDRSPWIQSLNGVWKFHYSQSPAARPVAFEQPAFEDAAWADIRVPGNWEIQGSAFRSTATRGTRSPTTQGPAAQRNDNPVGSYRTRFEVPAAWAGRRVLLHFAGVDSAFYVWVNGQRVGYNEDSRTPAEFDVTRLVQPGPNLLAVEVYRWSDGSYLEDQDMFRLSGSTGTCICGAPRRRTSGTSRSAPSSTRPIGTACCKRVWPCRTPAGRARLCRPRSSSSMRTGATRARRLRGR